MNASSRSQIFTPCRILLGVVLTFAAGFGLTSCGSQAATESTVLPTPHEVTLSWTASISPVSGYVVYRATDPNGPYIPLGMTLAGITQYADTNVTAGQTYFYEVTAFDSSNVESAPSNSVSATVPPS
jgi:fibronectin type 3 domain-containing protein